MVDIVDRATRSRMMSGIKGKDTRPELVLRKALHRLGFRYSLHSKGLPGRPDMVLSRFRAAILVHGCFWHRHEGCRFATTPASNKDFWTAKFEATVSRDARTVESLRNLGWRVAIVWECRLTERGLAKVIARLSSWLVSASSRIEIS